MPLDKEKLKKRNASYYQRHKEEIWQSQKYKDKKKEYNKQYYKRNKIKVLEINNRCVKARISREPSFKIRKTVSKLISKALHKAGTSKYGISCFKFLNYSIDQLKNHLEKQFEPWMNWNNYGKYDSSIWDDNNSETWKWQLDHIVPQSMLPYGDMNEENFKKCWSLSNLRPLSAKQNFLDGVQRLRHNK